MLHRSFTYPALSGEAFMEHVVFFDIETTGFSARFHHVALISLGRQQDQLFILDQYLAEAPEEESLILISALKALQDAPLTVTYNGNQFDIPFINRRLKALQQGWELDKERSLDLYRALGKGKLIHNEAQSGYLRRDTLSGKEWAERYRAMLRHGDGSLSEALLLHNAEDVYALYHLMAHRKELAQLARQRLYDVNGIKLLKQAVVGTDHIRLLFYSAAHQEEVMELPLITYHQFKIYAHPHFDTLSASQKKQCFLVEGDHLHLDRLHALVHEMNKQKI